MLGRTGERDIASTTGANSTPGSVEHPDVTRAAAATTAARAFARQWEFWLVLALGAFLRLWHIELTQFLQDQAALVALARHSALHGLLPVTSNISSIGTDHLPLIEYLLLPFLIGGHDPLPAVIALALWNVLGVAVAYLFARRAFGRRTAAIATLLLATSGVAVNYSRFIWQPTYWAPLLAVWALSLYAGALRGRRGWLVLNVGALTLAAMLHPVAAVLAPVTLLALLLAPRRPALRDYALSALVVLVVALPAALFELLSHGADLRLYAQLFVSGHGKFGLAVLRSLYGLFSAPSTGDFGPAAPYAALAPLSAPLNLGAALLFAVGYLVVSVAVVRPAVLLWQRDGGGRRTRSWAAARAYVGEVWRGLRADAGWKGMLLLWLWVTLPPLAMLHYTTTTLPAVHYLLVLVPGVFVVAALGMGWLLDQAARLARQGLSRRDRLAGGAGRIAWAGLVAALALLVAGQALQSALYVGSLASGHFAAYQFYGYPLAEVQHADAQLGALQRQQGARTLFVVLPAAARYAAGMEYLLVGEHADRTGIDPTCLALPAPASGPALVAVTAPNTPAGALLASLPGSQRVAQIAVAGGAPWPVYRLAGQAPPLLADEHVVAPATFVNAAGEGLRLEAVAQPAAGLLRLRWEVLGYAPASAEQPELSVATQAPGATVTAPVVGGVPQATATTCHPTRLEAGETLFTWMQLPASIANSAAISVASGTSAWDAPTLGPLHLLTGRPAGMPLTTLQPSTPGSSVPALPGQISGDTFVVPLS